MLAERSSVKVCDRLCFAEWELTEVQRTVINHIGPRHIGAYSIEVFRVLFVLLSFILCFLPASYSFAKEGEQNFNRRVRLQAKEARRHSNSMRPLGVAPKKSAGNDSGTRPPNPLMPIYDFINSAMEQNHRSQFFIDFTTFLLSYPKFAQTYDNLDDENKRSVRTFFDNAMDVNFPHIIGDEIYYGTSPLKEDPRNHTDPTKSPQYFPYPQPRGRGAANGNSPNSDPVSPGSDPNQEPIEESSVSQ